MVVSGFKNGLAFATFFFLGTACARSVDGGAVSTSASDGPAGHEVAICGSRDVEGQNGPSPVLQVGQEREPLITFKSNLFEAVDCSALAKVINEAWSQGELPLKGVTLVANQELIPEITGQTVYVRTHDGKLTLVARSKSTLEQPTNGEGPDEILARGISNRKLAFFKSLGVVEPYKMQPLLALAHLIPPEKVPNLSASDLAVTYPLGEELFEKLPAPTSVGQTPTSTVSGWTSGQQPGSNPTTEGSPAQESLIWVSDDIRNCLKHAGGLACINTHKLETEPTVPGVGSVRVDATKIAACIEGKKAENPLQDQSACLTEGQI